MEQIETAAAEAALRARVLEKLREVMDPELGFNVVDLGLVYGIEIDGSAVHVRLTMTTPACPLGEQIVRDAKKRLQWIEGVTLATVALVWDPPWGPERMSPDVRAALGWGT